MNRETLLPSDTIPIVPFVDDTLIQKADTAKLTSKESGRQAVKSRKVPGDELTRPNTDYERKVHYFEKIFDESFISKKQQEAEEDTLATGLEHSTMLESVGHGEAENDGSNNEDDDLDMLNGQKQINGENLSSDPVDAWTLNQLCPSYNRCQEDDDAVDALFRETFQADNDSKAGDPVANVLANTKPSSSSRRSVTFSTVELHTHDLILGDNLAISAGPLLSTDWEGVKSDILDLEEYEASRPPRRKQRDLIVPKTVREAWLRDAEYARSDLAEVEDEMKVIKKQCQRTILREMLFQVYNDSNAGDTVASLESKNRSTLVLANTKPSSSRRRVTFSTVAFHRHYLILGDNPAVSGGPPLTIGWQAVKSDILDLDEYETSRPPRREKYDLIVPKLMRKNWLLGTYTRRDLAKVEDEIKVIKKHRRRNAHKGFWEQVREVYGSSNRSVRQLTVQQK
jgi:hypothetical protein